MSGTHQRKFGRCVLSLWSACIAVHGITLFNTGCCQNPFVSLADEADHDTELLALREEAVTPNRLVPPIRLAETGTCSNGLLSISESNGFGGSTKYYNSQTGVIVSIRNSGDIAFPPCWGTIWFPVQISCLNPEVTEVIIDCNSNPEDCNSNSEEQPAD